MEIDHLIEEPISSFPKNISVSITSHCNLACSFCNHFSTSRECQNELTGDQWITLFERLSQVGAKQLIIEGGEPLIRNDLKTIINSIVNSGMTYGILTNGTLLTKEIASFFKSTGNCNFIQVSLDGSKSEIHDVFRGNGSFKRTMEGIEILKNANINIEIATLLNRYNVKDIENIVQLVLEGYNIPRIGIVAAQPIGLGYINKEMVKINIEQKSIAMKVLTELKKGYNDRIYGGHGPLYDSYDWKEMIKTAYDSKYREGGGYLSGCTGIFYRIAIRSDGIIVPCLQLSHLVLGKFSEIKLLELWKYNSLLTDLRNRLKIPLSDFYSCHDCVFINTCFGGCPGIAFEKFHQTRHPDSANCLRAFIMGGGNLPDRDINKIAKELCY